MASVSVRKRSGKWNIRFRHSRKKEHVIYLPGSLHKSTVEKKAAWYEEQMKLNRFDPWNDNPAEDMLVWDVLHEYLDKNKENGNWSEATYKGNVSVLKRFLEPVQTEQIDHVTNWQQLFNSLNGNAYTKKSDRTRINAFLNHIYKEGYVQERYKVDLSMNTKVKLRNNSNLKYITRQQVEDVCKAHRWLYRQNKRIFKTHGRKPVNFYPNIYWFLFYSLLRKEEVPKLRVKDLIGKKLRVKGKGRRTDIITLPPPALELAQWFAEGKDREDRLIVSHMNRPEHHLQNAVELALGDEAPSKGFHMFRHSGVAYYLSEKVPIEFVSKLCRHKSVRITAEVYADILPDKMDEVFSKIDYK